MKEKNPRKQRNSWEIIKKMKYLVRILVRKNIKAKKKIDVIQRKMMMISDYLLIIEAINIWRNEKKKILGDIEEKKFMHKKKNLSHSSSLHPHKLTSSAQF